MFHFLEQFSKLSVFYTPNLRFFEGNNQDYSYGLEVSYTLYGKRVIV